MAGGPSAPELCVAVTNAGGLGNIAAGYLTPEKLISAIQQVEGETDGPYGINIFCPPPDRERSSKDQDLWKRYRVLLEKDTQILGELPEQPFTGGRLLPGKDRHCFKLAGSSSFFYVWLP
ncbi:nitronate monooxygenase [Corynebacterium belfantii]|uniref:nitronate monooxygenase n=1 Tax=Corynebacterium belfantii TaxID=2014537 RepID=UPI0035A95DB0